MRVYVLYKGENGKDLDHWGFYTNKESAITDKEYLQSKYHNENIWINDYELETKPFLHEHFNKCEKAFKQLFISKLAQHMAQSLNGETMVNETYKTQRVNCKCITEYCEKEDCIYQKTENIGHNDIIEICTLFEALDIISGLYRWVTTGKEDDNDITAYYYNDRPYYKYMNEIFELLGINMKVKKKE